MSDNQAPAPQQPDQQPPAVVAIPPVQATAPAPLARKKRSFGKTLLMLSLPVVLAVGGGWYWLHAGRYVSTENAYVQQDKVPVAPEISGRISKVFVKADQPVVQGTELFEIDHAAFEIALARATSAVSAARLQVEQMRNAWHQAKVNVDTAAQTLEFQKSQLARQTKLRSTGVNTQDDIDKSRHAVDLAEAALADAKAKLEGALAALDGDPQMLTDSHPLVATALAAQAQAELDMKNTLVVAPVDGIVAQSSNLQAGEYVKAGTPMLAVVATGNAWVEANFNETDLTHMRVGQKAKLELDAFPGREIEAKIISIGAGTGSTFSLLPAQNATGNWVKVVQRVPVRLELQDVPEGELRAGLSVSVSVDTGYQRPLPAFAQALLGTNEAHAAQ